MTVQKGTARPLLVGDMVQSLQHPAVAGQRTGGVFDLTLQPPGGISFKGGVPVLGETGFHQAFQLFCFVGNVLGNAPGLHRIWDSNGLGLADFLAVRPIAVADSDFKFAVIDLFDACQMFSPFSEMSRAVLAISLPTQCFFKGNHPVGLANFFDALASQSCYILLVYAADSGEDVLRHRLLYRHFEEQPAHAVGGFIHDAFHRGGDDVGQVVLGMVASEVANVEL